MMSFRTVRKLVTIMRSKMSQVESCVRDSRNLATFFTTLNDFFFKKKKKVNALIIKLCI